MGQKESRHSGKLGDVVLSDSDKKAIRDAWKEFCKSHPEPGPVLFLALLDKHPGYQTLFREFREVPKDSLTQLPMFKTHSSAMGKLLSDVVELLDSPVLLTDVVRTNALEHAARDGVLPLHFESLWNLVAAQLSVDAQLPRAAASSWEKLLKAMQAITVEVYKKIGITSAQEQPMPSSSGSVQGAIPSKQLDNPEGASPKPEASKLEVKSSSEPNVTKTEASNLESRTASEKRPKQMTNGHEEHHARHAKGTAMEATAPKEKSTSDSKSSKSKPGLLKRQ